MFALPTDCCTGPPVTVQLAHWAPLRAELKPTVVTDDPDRTYRATLHPKLIVGRHLIGWLKSFEVESVSRTPTRVTVKVPAAVRAAAERYGARTHHRHATLTFVIHATDSSGHVYKPWGDDTFVTL